MRSLPLAKFRQVHLQNAFTRAAAIQSSSCGHESSQLDTDLLWQRSSYTQFSLSVCGSILSRVNFQILQFYQGGLESWLSQCISYYVNKPDRVSGNEVTDPFISHLVFSSFLLISVISWGYQASSSGNTNLEDRITAAQEFMGKWRWLRCDVHVCWGRSAGSAEVRALPLALAHSRGCLPHSQTTPKQAQAPMSGKAGEPMPKVTPHQRGAWTEDLCLSCFMGQLYISGVFPGGLSFRCPQNLHGTHFINPLPFSLSKCFLQLSPNELV